MSAEENKALILQWLEIEQREGREAMLAMHDPACSFPDLAFYGLPPTLDGYKQFLAAAAGAFSAFSYTVEVIVAEGDTVMVWGTEHSTHTGRWRNIPATNKHVSYRVVACYRLAHGKLIEHRLLVDSLSFLQQVGAIPSSG
jgi:steroid delta-isomerase-like uncharacterized protein